MLSRWLSQMLGLRGRRATAEIIGAGFLIATICWYFGVDVWHAILLGCAITVTALALRAGSLAPARDDLNWPGDNRGRSAGSRNDIANLSVSLRSDWGFVGRTAERHLQQIARRRLALEGLDLDNAEHRPAIEQRIGADTYRVLMSSQARLPTLRTLVGCLDALDAIDSHYTAPEPRRRRRRRPATPFRLRRPRER